MTNEGVMGQFLCGVFKILTRVLLPTTKIAMPFVPPNLAALANAPLLLWLWKEEHAVS
jgi:hypothetical protein